jgi:hypothetical protein
LKKIICSARSHTCLPVGRGFSLRAFCLRTAQPKGCDYKIEWKHITTFFQSFSLFFPYPANLKKMAPSPKTEKPV